MGSVVAFALWVLVGTGIGLAPRRFHWRGAIALIAAAGPLLIWIGLDGGALWALAAAAAMASILRWPLLFLARRLAGLLGGGPS